MTTPNPDDVVIYQYRTSYWSQMVRLAAVEKGISFKRVDIDIIKGDNYAPDYLKINPACEVPALSHRGRIISGSQKIIDYLDALRAENSNNNDSDKFSTDKLLAVENFRKECCALPVGEMRIGVCLNPNLWHDVKVPDEIVTGFRHRVNRAEILKANLIKYPELADAYRDKLSRVISTEEVAADPAKVKAIFDDLEIYLDKVNEQLRNAPKDGWLYADSFRNADITFATLLARLDQMGFAGRLWDHSARTYLADYYRRLKLRPAFQQECVYGQ